MIDTREQRPLDFSGYETIRGTLKQGDYSLKGFEDRVAVERKSREDAYGCVGKSRERFERCLQRLSALDRAVVVIECSLGAFATPPERTLITSRMAVGSYISWSVQYRVPVVWCDTRAHAERYVLRFLAAFMRHCASPGD